MSGAALKKSFDYSMVDKDTKSDLIYFADQILKARDAAARSIIEMGKALADAQDRLANHSGGVFIQWVETECGFSERTAYNFIYSYREFGSFATVAKLEDGAMYALAQPSTPKKARIEAMKLAEKGVSITQAKAKEIIAKHKAKESEKVQIAPSKTRSETGKPGGVGMSSSDNDPVSDGPASSEPAAETDPFDVDPFEETEEPAQEAQIAPSKGKETVSASKLVDDLVRSHVGHIARGLTNIAEANGGEGEQFNLADAGLNQLIDALKKMREGNR